MKFFSWSTSFLCLALCGVMNQTAMAGHFADQAAAKAARQRAKKLQEEDASVRQVCTILAHKAGDMKGTAGSGLLMDSCHVLTALQSAS